MIYSRNWAVIIFFLIFISPFNAINTSGVEGNSDESILLHQFDRNEENSLIPYLFNYEKIENSLLRELSSKIPSERLRFFNNLGIGVIYLAETDVQAFSVEFKDISKEMCPSDSFKVLPKVETMNPKGIGELDQLNIDLPSEIINASPLWTSGFTGLGVSIAILDSGIDDSHQNFDEITYQESFVTIENGYSSDEPVFDLHGHGTHVAGIAAGNGVYGGVAYDADLINLKVADMFGGATSLGFVAAMDKAIELNVDIISISLGFEFSTPWSEEDLYIESVNRAVDHGINVVVAAGNEGSGNVPFATINTPGSASKVITVGAMNRNNSVADFSSQGPTIDYRLDPDIVAPGSEIVGPLANGGVMDLAYNSLVGVSISDYIILSGTSMAAPVVSGAVALLKQQFPDASPHAIRAALLSSAIDLGNGETVYTQGSGLIDVGAASNLLSNRELISGFDLISSLPRSNEHTLEFYNQITFPGDQTSIMLSFITGAGGTLTWEISGNLTSLVSFDTSSFEVTSADYFERELKIHIPLDTPLGIYQGRLDYWFRGKNYFFPLEFDIKAPSQRIYWDRYHTGIDDSSLLGYRSLKTVLGNLEKPDDLNEYNSPISYSNISNAELLVLTDLEYPLTEREISYIEEFHENNGSILLLTSFVPYFNPDPYQKIAEALNLPVDFSSGSELITYTDDGRDRIPISIGISNEDLSWSPTNPLNDNIIQIPRLGGSSFDVDLNRTEVAFSTQYLDQSVIAGFQPENMGKVLFLGSETWIQDPYLNTLSGKYFLENVLDWLFVDKPVTNLNFSADHQELEIAVYPSSNVNFSVNVSFSNGSLIENVTVVYNNTLGFSFARLVIGDMSNQEIYIEVIDSTNASIYSEISILEPSITTKSLVNDIEIEYGKSADIEIPSWADTDQEFLDDFLAISIDHELSSFVSAQLIITTQYETTLEVLVPPLSSINFSNDELIFSNISITEKLVRWNVSESNSVGYYAFEVQIWWNSQNNHALLINSTRGQFYIPDTEPRLLPELSSIGGMSLSDHREILTLRDIPSWSTGETIDIIIQIEDQESEDFVVYYQLIHYYLFAAEAAILNSSSISPSLVDSSMHQGTFIVPEEPIPLPDEEGFEIKVRGEIFVLLFFIRDNQGNSIIEPIFFQVSNSFNLDIPLLILSGGLILGLIAMVIVLIRRTSQDRYDPFSPTSTYSEPSIRPTSRSFKYCIHCGKQIPIESAFCGYCGENLKK